MSEQPEARIVQVGEWLYDNEAPSTVIVFAINYDYYYEMTKEDEQLEEGEKPQLNADGETYMIQWGEGDFFESTSPKEYGGLSLEESMQAANRKVDSEISWRNPKGRR